MVCVRFDKRNITMWYDTCLETIREGDEDDLAPWMMVVFNDKDAVEEIQVGVISFYTDDKYETVIHVAVDYDNLFIETISIRGYRHLVYFKMPDSDTITVSEFMKNLAARAQELSLSGDLGGRHFRKWLYD